MNELEKKTAQGIVNIFETGRLAGNYGSVVVTRGDPGHLTFGRSQATLASGSLYLLIKCYCETPGAVRAEELRPYLDRLQAIDLTLDQDLQLRSVLAHAGADAIMQQTQDRFFEKNYWDTAIRLAETA